MELALEVVSNGWTKERYYDYRRLCTLKDDLREYYGPAH